jgi:hypothetical protein
MVSQHIAVRTPESADVVPMDIGGCCPYLPAFKGLGAEFTTVWPVTGIWDIPIRYVRTKTGKGGGSRTLLLMSQ